MKVDSRHPLYGKLVDAITRSPQVKDVSHEYAQPGTIFEGQGFKLLIDKSSSRPAVEFTIYLDAGTVRHMVISENRIRIVSQSSSVKNLVEALRQSPSAHVIKDDSEDSRTSSQPGAVAVSGSARDQSSGIFCEPSFDFKTDFNCAFTISN